MQDRFSHGTPDCPGANRSRIVLIIIIGLLTICGLSTNVHAQLKAAAAANGVTLTWTAPGDDGDQGTADRYDLRYSTVPITQENWNDWTYMIAAQNEPLPAVAGTIQSMTIDSLNPSTTYYFAMKAGDEAGNWSLLSNVVTYTTPAESDPPAAIADLHVIETGETSVTIGWTAPGDDGATGTASGYIVRYYTEPITETNWDAATDVADVPAPSAPGTAETLTINSLTPGVTYYFAVKTADEVPNWSTLSNVVSASPAGDTTPPAAIMDLITS